MTSITVCSKGALSLRGLLAQKSDTFLFVCLCQGFKKDIVHDPGFITLDPPFPRDPVFPLSTASREMGSEGVVRWRDLLNKVVANDR